MMSDRREAVAQAIYEKVALWVEDDPDQTVPWGKVDDRDWIIEGNLNAQLIREFADAALAAMDAEPTEAEVAAAWRTYKAHPTPWPTPHPANPHDGYPEELEQARIQGMRAALIAARKARQ